MNTKLADFDPHSTKVLLQHNTPNFVCMPSPEVMQKGDKLTQELAGSLVKSINELNKSRRLTGLTNFGPSDASFASKVKLFEPEKLKQDIFSSNNDRDNFFE